MKLPYISTTASSIRNFSSLASHSRQIGPNLTNRSRPLASPFIITPNTPFASTYPTNTSKSTGYQFIKPLKSHQISHFSSSNSLPHVSAESPMDIKAKESYSLLAICPLDGRYRKKVESVASYFSEFAYIKHRVEVEIEYFLTLLKIDPPLKNLASINLSASDVEKIRSIYKSFSLDDALWVRRTEYEGGADGGPELPTNHDVKAIEYLVKYKLQQLAMSTSASASTNLNGSATGKIAIAYENAKELLDAREYVHFGLTSQDVSNTAIPLMTKRFIYEEYLPELLRVVCVLDKFARKWKEVAMLARTHGQPASPTRMGKELMVFVSRLRTQIVALDGLEHSAKFGGATGNMNSHVAAFPDHNWPKIFDEFIEGLGLKRLQFTTQIDNYDNAAAIFQAVCRINTILTDFCRDMWMYIGFGLFKQKLKKGEIGSSAMPHKVNPIDFENAEGNLGIAISTFDFLANKLPISRLQRDLTDSTACRNIGVPFGHSMVALNSIRKGIDKLVIDEKQIHSELNEHWEVVAEGIQTILRREKVNGAYELLKDATRGEVITKARIEHFISLLEKKQDLKLSQDVINELKHITPHNYIGIFEPGPELKDYFEAHLKPESFKVIESILN